MERIILHSDLNNFFASVEAVINPEYGAPDKFIAVCGLEEDRHGIVLAKNENAKRAGVKTGDTIWQAKQKCPDIIIIPPHFDKYCHYSKIVREIYLEYTDEVEAFGMDECWLDVTRSTSLFGSGETIAQAIRKRVKKETGLTVSIGVSFNKVFAKLCSDLKKPDAVTIVNHNDFKDRLWKLPANNMLGVGSSTYRTLERHGIFTIGDIARTPEKYLEKWLGKNGYSLHTWANGMDSSPVTPFDYTPSPKSISHGVTCRSDLENNEEANRILLFLIDEISSKLRKNSMIASKISVCVKNSKLESCEYTHTLLTPTRSRDIIYKAASELFSSSYKWTNNVRSLCVRASKLVFDNEPVEIDLFTDTAKMEKLEKKDRTIDFLCKRYGKQAIMPASLLSDIKLPHIINESLLPPAIKAR